MKLREREARCEKDMILLWEGFKKRFLRLNSFKSNALRGERKAQVGGRGRKPGPFIKLVTGTKKGKKRQVSISLS